MEFTLSFFFVLFADKCNCYKTFGQAVAAKSIGDIGKILSNSCKIATCHGKIGEVSIFYKSGKNVRQFCCSVGVQHMQGPVLPGSGPV